MHTKCGTVFEDISINVNVAGQIEEKQEKQRRVLIHLHKQRFLFSFQSTTIAEELFVAIAPLSPALLSRANAISLGQWAPVPEEEQTAILDWASKKKIPDEPALPKAGSSRNRAVSDVLRSEDIPTTSASGNPEDTKDVKNTENKEGEKEATIPAARAAARADSVGALKDAIMTIVRSPARLSAIRSSLRKAVQRLPSPVTCADSYRMSYDVAPEAPLFSDAKDVGTGTSTPIRRDSRVNRQDVQPGVSGEVMSQNPQPPSTKKINGMNGTAPRGSLSLNANVRRDSGASTPGGRSGRGQAQTLVAVNVRVACGAFNTTLAAIRRRLDGIGSSDETLQEHVIRLLLDVQIHNRQKPSHTLEHVHVSDGFYNTDGGDKSENSRTLDMMSRGLWVQSKAPRRLKQLLSLLLALEKQGQGVNTVEDSKFFKTGSRELGAAFAHMNEALNVRMGTLQSAADAVSGKGLKSGGSGKEQSASRKNLLASALAGSGLESEDVHFSPTSSRESLLGSNGNNSGSLLNLPLYVDSADRPLTPTALKIQKNRANTPKTMLLEKEKEREERERAAADAELTPEQRFARAMEPLLVLWGTSDVL